MSLNPQDFIDAADVGDRDDIGISDGIEVADVGEPLDLDQLPTGVVSGTTLIDFSAVPSVAVRAGVSMAMLFASRVATKATNIDGDADEWLASYTSNLSKLGFALAGSSIIKSQFKKTDVSVHKAIIPFLTIALGGAAVGPVIMALLNNLQEMNQDSPWITLFNKTTRRFDAQEMHFAAVSSTATDTSIRYAIARLHVDTSTTSILFFKITKATAEFESSSTVMSANNSLLALMDSALRQKLGKLTQEFIAEAAI